MKAQIHTTVVILLLSFLLLGDLMAKPGGLIVSVDVQALLQSLMHDAKAEYMSLWEWGVCYRCKFENEKERRLWIQIGIFDDENKAKEMYQGILFTRSSLAGMDFKAPVGNERVTSKSGDHAIFRRDNVLIEIGGMDLPMLKALDKKLVDGKDGVRRGNRLTVPEITGYELKGNKIMALTKPVLDGHTTCIDITGHITSDLRKADAICFATKDCVMARPFKFDGEALRSRLAAEQAAEQARAEAESRMPEEEFMRLVAVLESPGSGIIERKNAVLALGQCGDERAVPVLVAEMDRLEGRFEPVLRCLTIRALGMLGSRSAVRRLGAFLGKPPKGDLDNEENEPSGEPIDRREAVISLAAIGGPEARRILESVARSDKEYRSVREVAAHRLEILK